MKWSTPSDWYSGVKTTIAIITNTKNLINVDVVFSTIIKFASALLNCGKIYFDEYIGMSNTDLELLLSEIWL